MLCGKSLSRLTTFYSRRCLTYSDTQVIPKSPGGYARPSALRKHGDLHEVKQASNFQIKIGEFAKMEQTEKTLHMLLRESQNRDKNKVVRSCQFMHHEFLIRIAKVISHIQNLPYIVLCNDDIKRVHDLYVCAFSDLLKLKKINSIGDVDLFNEFLSGLLDDFQDIIELLSRGFHKSKIHASDDVISRFMDYMIIHRLCNRIMARHHLSMHVNRDGYISIINLKMDLKKAIQRNAAFSANVCQNVYMDTLPEVIIDGHTDTTVSFIPNILEYVLKEILKNSYRATVEAHLHSLEKPPIVCTISNSENYWCIRISDKGKGMSDKVLKDVQNYCYTTYNPASANGDYSAGFGELMSHAVQNKGASSLAGFGVGIPVSHAYVNFVRGNLSIMTMDGIGTDVYIKVPHLHKMLSTVRI